MIVRRVLTCLGSLALAAGTIVPAASAGAADPLPPVRDAKVAAVTTTSATVQWVNPKLPAFKGVSIRRHDGAWSSEGSVFRVATAGPVDQYTDTGLTPGSTYSYGLYASHGSSGFAPVEVVTVTVPSAPSLTGRVIAATGGFGLTNVVATAYDNDGRVSGKAVTGADGSYEISGLTAGGRYRVCFSPEPLDRTLTTGKGYLAACSGGSALGGATRVTAPASKVGGALPTGGSINGKAVDDDGKPVAGVTIVLGDYESDPVRYTTTGQDGKYNFAGVPEQSYTVCADPARSSNPALTQQCWAYTTSSGTPTHVGPRPDFGGDNVNFDLYAAGNGAGYSGPNTRYLYQDACAGVLFLAARGQGQSGAGGSRNLSQDTNYNVGGALYGVYQDMKSKLEPAGLTMTRATSVAYRADNTLPDVGNTDYVRSVWSAVRETRRALTDRATQCPNETIVLAGLGQGASVMRRVLTNAVTTGVPALDPAILARLQASVLLGGSDRVADDPVVRFGDADPSGQGVLTQVDQSVSGRPVTTAMGAGVFDVCATGDVLCDSHVPYGCTAATLGTCPAYRATYATGEPVSLYSYNGTALSTAAAEAAAARVLRAPHIKALTPLPTGKVGSKYTADLKTVDDRAGTWTIGSGLPHGLTFQGKTISGTPDTVEYAAFTATFTDAQGRRTSAKFTIYVRPQANGVGVATQLPPGANPLHVWAAANGDSLVSYAKDYDDERYLQWNSPTGPRGPVIQLPTPITTRVVIDEQNTAYVGIRAVSASTGGSLVAFTDGESSAYTRKAFAESAGDSVYRAPTDLVYSGQNLYLAADVPKSCTSPRLYRLSPAGAVLAEAAGTCGGQLGVGGGYLIERSGTDAGFRDLSTLAAAKSYKTDTGQLQAWSSGPTGDVAIATRSSAGTRLFRVTAAGGVVWQSSLNDVLGETDQSRTHYVRSLTFTSDNTIAVAADTVNDSDRPRAFVSAGGTVTGRSSDDYTYAIADLPDGDGHVLASHSNYCYATVPCTGVRTDRYDATGEARVYTGPTPPSSFPEAVDQAISPGRLHLLVTAQDEYGRSVTKIVVVDVAGLRPAAWPVP